MIQLPWNDARDLAIAGKSVVANLLSPTHPTLAGDCVWMVTFVTIATPSCEQIVAIT